MKPLIVLAALVGALVALNHSAEVHHAKKASPAYLRRREAQDARIGRALASLKRGDLSQQAEVRAVIAGLESGDFRRPSFAGQLAARGEVQAAYGLERTRAHFMEHGVPDDREMAFYADLARKAGHPEEAAWARERTGEDGHFRVWKRGEEAFFTESDTSYPNTLVQKSIVDRHMSNGLRLYPAYRNEIETLRQKLLAESVVP